MKPFAALTVLSLLTPTIPAAHAACPDFAGAIHYSAGVNSHPRRMVTADFNGDGRADLAETNPEIESVGILLANGAGTFAAATQYAVGDYPYGLATGDFNRDGRADLAVTDLDTSTMKILLGNGAGGFTLLAAYLTHAGPEAIATGDLNRDGKVDLVTGNSNDQDVSVFLGDGLGGFATPAHYPMGMRPSEMGFEDFDGDGDLDLVAVGNNTIAIASGNGAGEFGPASTITIPATSPAFSSLTSVVIGDFNRDGRPDVAAANSGKDNVVVLTRNATGFDAPVELAAGAGPIDLTAADFNGDALLDLATTSYLYNTIQVLIGDGSGTFDSPIQYLNGGTAPSLLAADFNADGRTDIASANQSGSVSILLNDGACRANCGTFATGTNLNFFSSGLSVATGDLNRDGRLDLAVSTDNTAVSFFMGSGGGHFNAGSDYPLITSSPAIALADVNQDGKLDLAAVHPFLNTVSIGLGDGAGGFATATSHTVCSPGGQPRSIASGDFNRDGRVDFAVGCGFSLQLGVLLNTTAASAGTATFTSTTVNPVGTAQGPRGVATGDFNNDGRLDVAVANYGDGANPGSVFILVGTGAGGFILEGTPAAGVGPQAVGTGHFNSDAFLDLAVVNSGSNNTSILLGNGSGGFTSNGTVSVGLEPSSIAVADLDNDGDRDLAITNRSGNDTSVLLGNGSGGFTASPASHLTNLPSSVVAGDFNRDGTVDLAIATGGGNGSASVLRNSCPAADLQLTAQGLFALTQGGSDEMTVQVRNLAQVATTER